MSVNHTTGSIVSLRKCLSRCSVIFSTLKAHSQACQKIFCNWKPFKNDEKCLFYLKSSFGSQEI